MNDENTSRTLVTWKARCSAGLVLLYRRERRGAEETQRKTEECATSAPNND